MPLVVSERTFAFALLVVAAAAAASSSANAKVRSLTTSGSTWSRC